MPIRLVGNAPRIVIAAKWANQWNLSLGTGLRRCDGEFRHCGEGRNPVTEVLANSGVIIMRHCFHLCRWISLTLLGAVFIAMPALADDESSVVDLMRNGQLNQASSIADRRLAKHPRDPAMRFLKGLLQQKSGRQREAIATYRRLIQDHPALPEPYYNLALLYAAQGQFEQSRTALEQAAQASRSLANIHEKLGDVYAHLAMGTYRQSMQPQDPGLAQTASLPLIQQLIVKPAQGMAEETGAATSRGFKGK